MQEKKAPRQGYQSTRDSHCPALLVALSNMRVRSLSSLSNLRELCMGSRAVVSNATNQLARRAFEGVRSEVPIERRRSRTHRLCQKAVDSEFRQRLCEAGAPSARGSESAEGVLLTLSDRLTSAAVAA